MISKLPSLEKRILLRQTPSILRRGHVFAVVRRSQAHSSRKHKQPHNMTTICWSSGYMHESRGARQVHSNTNQDNTFFKGKWSCPGWTRTHDTLLSRQSALPTELPGQLSKQGSKSTTQHNTRQSQTPILRVLWHRKPSLNMYAHDAHDVLRCYIIERESGVTMFQVIRTADVLICTLSNLCSQYREPTS